MEYKIANEAQKSLIRKKIPAKIADRMCNVIDSHEKAEHFRRFLMEWMASEPTMEATIYTAVLATEY